MRQVGLTWHERRQAAEQINGERQRVLEKLGVSVQDSGIKVAQNRYFLVNLNIDPCLNENLVYYLAPHQTIVGRVDTNANIQLSGLGIEEHHGVFTIEDDVLYMTPVGGARTCINGKPIFDKTIVHHLDRLLFGENHFFASIVLMPCPNIESTRLTPLLASLTTNTLAKKWCGTISKLRC